MNITLILVITIILVVIISFLVIKSLVKKNTSLKFKVQFAEKQMSLQNENIKNYKSIIVKLNNKRIESETIKKNISTASGSDLSKLANSL